MRTQPYDVAAMEAYIRNAAKARGINPDIAVRVAKSEGLGPGVWQSNFRKGGIREPSYGPFQLLVGGPGTGFPKGLGNDFIKKTGLDPSDPDNAYAAIDFALDRAAQKGWGEWYGAPKVGVSRWQGLKDAKPIGVRGTINEPVSPELATYREGVEAAGRIQSLPVDTSLQGLFDTPSLPGIDGGVPAERDSVPIAKLENPANRQFADNAVGDLFERDNGRPLPKTIQEMWSGAPDGTFMPGGPIERGLSGNEPPGVSVAAHGQAQTGPTQEASTVANLGGLFSAPQTDFTAVQPTQTAELGLFDPIGPEVAPAGPSGPPRRLGQRPDVGPTPTQRTQTAFSLFDSSPSTLATSDIQPIEPETYVSVDDMPVNPDLSPLAPPRTIPQRTVAEPAPRPSVRTVQDAVPGVAETVGLFDGPADPGDGFSYGYSPFGAGVAKVHDSASDRVKIAASGPGIFGAFKRDTGIDLEPYMKAAVIGGTGMVGSPITGGLSALAPVARRTMGDRFNSRLTDGPFDAQWREGRQQARQAGESNAGGFNPLGIFGVPRAEPAQPADHGGGLFSGAGDFFSSLFGGNPNQHNPVGSEYDPLNNPGGLI